MALNSILSLLDFGVPFRFYYTFAMMSLLRKGIEDRICHKIQSGVYFRK